MGKKRTIDSKIRTSQSFAGLTYRQRDLWQGIITTADDQGRMHANPMYVRSAVWPYDDIKPDEVAADLEALNLAGYIDTYLANDAEYLQIVKWWEYQQMQWAMKSDDPAPPGWVDKWRFHGKGGGIQSANWKTPGGYMNDNDDVKDNVNDDDDVKGCGQSSVLPSRLPSALPRKGSDDSPFSQSDIAGIARTYEATFGQVIVPFVAEELADLAEEVDAHRLLLPAGSAGASENGCAWIVEAIREGGKSQDTRFRGKSQVNYISAIVRRWMVDGFKAKRKANDKGDTHMSADDYLRMRDEQ